MHVQEKQAWFILTVAAATLTLLMLSLSIFGFHPAVLGSFGLFGFAGFAGLIGNRESKAGKVIMDERDRQIANTATAGGFSIAWALFVLAAMGPFTILGPNATVTLKTSTISFVVCPVMMVIFITRSLIVIYLYRRGSHA